LKSSIKQISEISGFSPATVSNVMNNKKGVNKETAERILKIAREVGYINESRISNIKLVIYKKNGLVVSDTPFFSSLIEGVERESRANDFETVICNINEQDDDFEQMRSQILSDHTSGILLLATELTAEDAKAFKNASAPLVMLDGWFEEMTFDTVLINNTDSVYNAVKYLVQKGHRKIGYLASNVRIRNFYYREMGYKRALENSSIPLNPAYTVELPPTMDGAYKSMLEYLDKKPELPTAFFADNDIIAFGAMKALKQNGYKIPNDISIIGFDDMPFCEISSPSLTTIRVFKQEMGQTAVKRLIDKMKSDSNISTKIQICTEFIERDSVKDLTK
jgi:Transcriptional regulators